MRENSSRSIPALNYRWLTFIYDPLLRSEMQEAKFKSHLVQQAKLRSACAFSTWDAAQAR